MSVIVIGGGIAGTAAAWAARRRGAAVALVHDRAGASELMCGALDREPWHEAPGPSLAGDRSPGAGLAPLEAAFVAALGAWHVGPRQAVVVTGAGIVRPAAGRDHALLDLAPLAGRRIAVADVARGDWDARALAAVARSSEWVRSTKTEIGIVELDLAGAAGDADLGAWELARRFDEPARVERLREAFARASGAWDAWLVGPWLGTASGVATRLREGLEVAVGESVSPVGGPAGARFAHARDELLAAEGVEVVRGAALEVTRASAGWAVRVRAERREESHVCARVVLAVGGVGAGGIVLTSPSEERGVGVGFELGLRAPVRMELDGRERDAASSLFGIDLAARGLGALERVGIVSPCGPEVDALLAAGDVVAGRPRTVLEAVRAGLDAGERAASAAAA